MFDGVMITIAIHAVQANHGRHEVKSSTHDRHRIPGSGARHAHELVKPSMGDLTKRYIITCTLLAQPWIGCTHQAGQPSFCEWA